VVVLLFRVVDADRKALIEVGVIVPSSARLTRRLRPPGSLHVRRLPGELAWQVLLPPRNIFDGGSVGGDGPVVDRTD